MILCYFPYNRAYLHVHKGEEKVKGLLSNLSLPQKINCQTKYVAKKEEAKEFKGFFGSCATIRISQELLCLLYARFFFSTIQ